MRSFGIPWTAAALLAAVPVRTAAAQPTGVLFGIVRDAAASVAVAGAEVVVGGSALRTLTDSAGHFTIARIPAGRHVLTIRRLGFALASTNIELGPSDTLDAEIGLQAVATRLPEVDIRARDPSKLKLLGFEQRRAAGFGHFIGPEAMAKAEFRPTADMMRQLPGTHLVRAQFGSESWLAGGRLASGTGKFTPDRFDRRRGAPDRECYATVYLDGTPVFSALPNEALFDVNSVPVNTLAAIEYYAGSAQVPPEYPQRRNTCGVLVLWTKG